MSLRDVPWDLFRDIAYTARRTFGRHQPNDIDFIVESITADEMRRLLRLNHFDDNNLTAYYMGEDYSMARPEYIPDDWEWYQTHVRIYEQPSEKGMGNCGLEVHQELDPSVDNYSKPHIKGVNYDKEAGRIALHKILEDLELGFTRVTK